MEHRTLHAFQQECILQSNLHDLIRPFKFAMHIMLCNQTNWLTLKVTERIPK